MSRHDLTDVEFNAIRVYLPSQSVGSLGRPWKDHRTVINGILWILATGSPWRDLPCEFGKWQTVSSMAQGRPLGSNLFGPSSPLGEVWRN